MAAETKIVGADFPIDPLRRISVRLRWRRAWLRKKTERETAGCDKPRDGFPHVEMLPKAARPVRPSKAAGLMG
jgi:hypothetical protein